MPNVNSPRGFKPARYVDGRPFNGALNPYRLQSGYPVNLFMGDVVKLTTSGYLAKANPGDQFRGVICGLKWVGANGVPGPQRYWPAGTVTLGNSDAQLLIADDPGLVFEAVFTNSASIPAVADIGSTFNLFDAGGSAATAQSGEGIDYSTGSAGTAQFRFLSFVNRSDNDLTSAYSRGDFAPALHDYRVNSGV